MKACNVCEYIKLPPKKGRFVIQLEKIKCRVGSVVTDNAANMAKMRRQLEENISSDLLTYGSSAHLLNLLGQDVQIPEVREQVIQIIKYFRNTHLPAAKYRASGGKALVLPHEVRWNTVSDCLESYIANWPILVKVCEEYPMKLIST